MAISGMAVEAGGTDISRTQTLERLSVLGELALEGSFAQIEFGFESLSQDRRCLILITAFSDIVGGAEFSSGIPLRSLEVAHSLADILGVGLPFQGGPVAIVAASDQSCRRHQNQNQS